MESKEPDTRPANKKFSAKYIVLYQVISLPCIVYIPHSEWHGTINTVFLVGSALNLAGVL